jgi:uncharacterized protein YceH (UPF0502 family)
MKRFSRWLKPLSILLLTLIVLLSWQTLTPAQDTAFLASRITRLENQNSALRSQLNQLESQVSRISSNIGLDYAQPAPIEISPSSPLTDDPMFDRLATLVIELRERIVELETQVADLQARVSGSPESSSSGSY